MVPTDQKSRSKKASKEARQSDKIVVLRPGTSGIRFNNFGKDGCGY